MTDRQHPCIRILGAAIVAALAAALAGCGSLFFTDGDELARHAAEDAAAQIGSHTDNTTEVTLREIVAWWVPQDPFVAGSGLATAEALAWSGAIGTDTEATVDVRIRTSVTAQSATTIGGRSNSAGTATVCYRLVWPRYEQARRSEIPCPDTPAPPRPEPEPRPELTDDDRARVDSILHDDVELADIRGALLAAFPADHMRIEAEVWKGETVVAVGIPRERECILAVRDAAGTVTYPSFRRISLEPGEVGCSTALYTNPPF